MTSRKKFSNESQDARRHDKHNATHKSDKLHEKQPQQEKRK